MNTDLVELIKPHKDFKVAGKVFQDFNDAKAYAIRVHMYNNMRHLLDASVTRERFLDATRELVEDAFVLISDIGESDYV